MGLELHQDGVKKANFLQCIGLHKIVPDMNLMVQLEESRLLHPGIVKECMHTLTECASFSTTF